MAKHKINIKTEADFYHVPKRGRRITLALHVSSPAPEINKIN